MTVRKFDTSGVLFVKRFLGRISVAKPAIRFDKKTHKVFYALEFDKERRSAYEDFTGKFFMDVAFSHAKCIYFHEQDIKKSTVKKRAA